MRIHFNTQWDKHTLLDKKKHWISHFKQNVTIYVNTYKIIVHAILTNVLIKNQKWMKILFYIVNMTWLTCLEKKLIKFVTWLIHKISNNKIIFMIIQFTSLFVINKTMNKSIMWNAMNLCCTLYNYNCKLKQCYNC